MRLGRSYLAGVAALAIGSCPVALWAQVPEELGGLLVEGDLSFRLESDDGEPEFRTGFDFGIRSATRTQILRFSGDYGLVVPLDGDGDTEFLDPTYRAEYLRNNGQTQITVSGFFQSTDVDGFALVFDPDADPDDFDEGDLVDDDGTRQRHDLDLGFEWGLRDPVGGTLSYSRSEITFIDTADPDLTDSLTTELAGTLRLDADPTLRIILDASHLMREEDDIPSTETDTRRAGVRTIWEMTPVLTFDGRLGWTRTVETEFGVDDVREGAEIAIDLGLDRPNGNWELSYDRVLTGVGNQNTLAVTRELALPGGADVAASLGVTHMPSGEHYGIGFLRYDRATQRGRINLFASRNVQVNSDDDEVIRDRFQASYSEPLPWGGSWSLSGSVFASDFTDPAENDLTTGQVSVNYAMPLTRDWDLSSGVTWREIREDGSDTDRESFLFISLERSFEFRP